MFEKEKLDTRIKYTREWTYGALVKLLDLKKYNEIKISEIINKAGISRATFYRNFSNKDEIVIYRVKTFFEEFYTDMLDYFKVKGNADEVVLIQEFFKRIDEEEKLIDTVIKTNLEYLMVEGVNEIITAQADLFYQLVKSNPVNEAYIMDIVASSTWTLLSRWHKSGKQETPQRLVKIFLSAFRSVYIALFEDKHMLK